MVHGCKKTLDINTTVECRTCDGSGAKPGSQPVTCQHCQGSGAIHVSQGFISLQQTCPYCQGTGQSIKDPCRTCRGEGRVQEPQSLTVTIPVGVDNGDRMRLSGKGEAGVHGGGYGDLFVEVQLKPHPIFKREDKNLHCEVPISFVTATLGGQLEIPTLNGKVSLKIPPETQTNSLFRLRGKGVPSARRGTPGDLMCHVVVETPVKLNKQQIDLLKSFEKTLAEGDKNSPKAKKWYQSIQHFFKQTS